MPETAVEVAAAEPITMPDSASLYALSPMVTALVPAEEAFRPIVMPPASELALSPMITAYSLDMGVFAPFPIKILLLPIIEISLPIPILLE